MRTTSAGNIAKEVATPRDSHVLGVVVHSWREIWGGARVYERVIVDVRG